MTVEPMKENPMKSSAAKSVNALALILVGLAVGVGGIYIGETDDAPGASLIAIVLMIGLIALGIRAARRKA